MGLKLIRIGNKINWTPVVVKRYPLLFFLVMFVAFILISKFCFDDSPKWYKMLFCIISGLAISMIDRQLPRKRYRDLGLLLGSFFLFMGGVAFNDLVINHVAKLDAGDYTIIIAVLLLSLGYCIYSMYQWRKQYLRLRERQYFIQQASKRRIRQGKLL